MRCACTLRAAGFVFLACLWGMAAGIGDVGNTIAFGQEAAARRASEGPEGAPESPPPGLPEKSTALEKSELSAKEDGRSGIPLVRVVAFSSGVAFFDHVGTIDGNDEITLRFRVRDINDLLKSLVLQDFDGGRISTVTYDAREPVARRLQSFTIDLTRATSLTELLAQVRGQRLEVSAGDRRVEGTIVGVTQRTETTADGRSIVRDTLLLSLESGLRRIDLDDVDEVRLMDKRLNDEFQEALEVLAGGHDDQWKSVTLRFRGEGKRRVRIGYVQEFPVWKTSYRLVLREDRSAWVQGWAIVENTTDHDWRDVQVTLVSGRPISFTMDLYEPLYATRPHVVPELFASLAPRVYEQNLQPAEAPVIATGPGGKPIVKANPPGAFGRGGFGGMGGGGFGGGFGGGGMGGFGGEGVNPSVQQPGADRPFVTSVIPVVPGIDPAAGIASAATGSEAGELFRYVIDEPVSLERQHSAMLPIVNQEVQAEKVAIFNQSVNAKHPLDGVRLTNSTGLHWMQGPIAVFDADQYAGDARIADVAPGGERLVSYALDLDIEIVAESGEPKPALVELNVDGFELYTKHRIAREHLYRLKSSEGKPHDVLIELPKQEGWTLEDEKQAAESTRSLYRFAVEAAPQDTTEFRVGMERFDERRIALPGVNDAELVSLIDATAASDEVKARLNEYLALRRKLAALREARANVTQRMTLVVDNQARIRANMAALDRQSNLYKTYVERMQAAEDEIDRHRQRVDELLVEESELAEQVGEAASESIRLRPMQRSSRTVPPSSSDDPFSDSHSVNQPPIPGGLFSVEDRP